MREYEAIVGRISADRPGRILDWGCGWGQMTYLLRRAGLDVDAFDYVGPGAPNGMVELQLFAGVFAYASSDPIRLPYSDASYDAVLSCGVLEHVEDPDASLEELKRVVRPGGTFYVYKLPNRSSYLELIAKRLGLHYHGQAVHDRLYTIESARELFVRHGFEVLELGYANMLPLTLTGRVASAVTPAVWASNRGLSRVPWLNHVATNVQLVARSPSGSSTRG